MIDNVGDYLYLNNGSFGISSFQLDIAPSFTISFLYLKKKQLFPRRNPFHVTQARCMAMQISPRSGVEQNH